MNQYELDLIREQRKMQFNRDFPRNAAEKCKTMLCATEDQKTEAYWRAVLENK